MANYSLVIDSTFRPFTYQELAAPLDRQEAYQEKLEEAYEQLSSQADVLEAMGANDRDKNSKTYGRYKAYSDSLRNEADNLYRFGLNTESRQRLTDLRRRYSQEIVPIQNAWQKREEEAKMQLSASMQNPSIMFTRDAKNTTLDEYINNPTGGFGVISGAQITAQMASMAKNLAKQIRSGERVDVDPFTYNYIQKYGLTDELIRDWRNNPTLSKMFQQVMQANGVTPEALQGSPNADAIISKSTNFAEMGMWDAIGETKSQLHDNKAAIMAAEEARQIRAEQRAATRQQQVLDQLKKPDGPPGHTVKGSFGDAAAAGKSLRSQMATAVANLYDIFNNDPKKANMAKMMKRAMGGEWGGHGSKEKAIEYWTDHGFNFNLFGTKIGNSIRNYVRTVTGLSDNDLINYWGAAGAKSASSASSGKPVTSSGAHGTPWRRDTNEPVTAGTPWNNPDKKVSGTPWSRSETADSASTKGGYMNSDKVISWRDFDNAAHNGYYMHATALTDDRSALNGYMQELFDRASRDGKVSLYDIESINGGNGKRDRAEIKYSDRRVSRDDLPKKKDGGIDYDAITRYQLPNGDMGFGWYDESKKRFVIRGMRAEDINMESDAFKKLQNNNYSNLNALLQAGIINREEYLDALEGLGQNREWFDYMETQGVDVPEYKIR